MKKLPQIGILLLLLAALSACNGQAPRNANGKPATDQEIVGGGCDGCELMFVGMPERIDAADTSAGWTEAGQKLQITGTVYKLDGRTPAADVIIYYWHTDNEGYYSPKDGMEEKARRHGHLRGWIRTGADGRYAIYTVRPAPYPDSNMPAHIHLSVKEPAIADEYYIDEFVFDDDPLLTGEKRKAMENRGGSGILRVLNSGDHQIAAHNIVLGLNIPGYPVAGKTAVQSGWETGED